MALGGTQELAELEESGSGSAANGRDDSAAIFDVQDSLQLAIIFDVVEDVQETGDHFLGVTKFEVVVLVEESIVDTDANQLGLGGGDNGVAVDSGCGGMWGSHGHGGKRDHAETLPTNRTREGRFYTDFD